MHGTMQPKWQSKEERRESPKATRRGRLFFCFFWFLLNCHTRSAGLFCAFCRYVWFSPWVKVDLASRGGRARANIRERKEGRKDKWRRRKKYGIGVWICVVYLGFGNFARAFPLREASTSQLQKRPLMCMMPEASPAPAISMTWRLAL